jgi:hypothetical protein
MGKQAQTATYVGLALAGLGFLLIGLAWDGAAEVDYIQGQFPYLISGGLTGLGLILVGVIVLVIQTMRRDGAKRGEQIRELAAAVAELQAQLAPTAVDDPALVGEYRPRPRQANGEALTEQIPQVVETRGRRQS